MNNYNIFPHLSPQISPRIRGRKWARTCTSVMVGFAVFLMLSLPVPGRTETKSYTVQISTSDIDGESGEGTDADVHITLYGTQSKDGTEKKLVQHSGRNFVTGRLARIIHRGEGV